MFFELKQQAEAEGYIYEAIRAIGRPGSLSIETGQLRQAERFFHEGIERLQQMGQARAAFGYTHIELARLSWLRNQSEVALSHLQIALQFAQSWRHI